MKKLSKLTIMVLTATSLAAAPISTVAPTISEFVTIEEVAAATTTITAKHSMNCPIIKKIGSYSVQANDMNNKVFAFQAPKAGTYVFKFKNLRGKGETTEDAFCRMGISVGKKLYYSKDNDNYGVCDYDRPVYWLNYLNQWNEKAEGLSLAAPAYAEAYAGYYSDAKDMEEYYSLPGSNQLTGTVKVKLKKGEKLYFGMNYKNNKGLNERSGDVGVVTLKITMK